ncbi:hypothetical protein HOI26_01095, partial [Candidatus Woesearchaeota archaeon]|nr:hypothetical protein [Candidatus Woesearchaeota archaeon]
ERNICERDNQPPVTNVEEVGVVSTVDPLLLFSATDNEALGKLHYCLLDASSGATAYCDDDVFEKNSYSFDRVFSDDVDVDILAGLDRLVDGQTYRLQYYSVDHYRNQEDLRETFIFLDNKVPEFTLDTQIITIGDTTELTVEVLGYLEPVSCTFLLDQRFPIGTLRSEEKTLEEEKTAAFNDLKGIHYNLTVNCKDQAGNVGTEEEWLVFDLAPNIDVVYPEIDGGVSTTRIEFEVHTDTASLCELRTVREDVKIADFLPEDDLKVHVTDSITGFFENTYYDTHKVVCTEALSGEEQTDYFSFAVDFTPPETKIVLKEGTRTERPLGLSWEASFVEQATMTFECDGGAVDCDKTFYCLGDSCATTRKEAFTEFVAQVFVNETTDVCYYSVDEGGNDAFPQCGTITIDGFGITLEQPEGYNYQNELWGVSNTSFFDVQFYTRVPSTECRYDFISGFTYESLSPHKILSPVEGHYLLPNFPNSTFSTYPSSGGVKTLYMVCEDSTGVKAPEQAINLEYDPSAPKITAAYAEPNPVAEGITVQLYLDTDDKTICKFSDNSDETGSKDFSIMAGKFPGVDEKELHTEHTTEYSISFLGEKKDYSLNVQCQNGAGALSEIKELTFTVDYTIAGNIVSLSPSGSIPSRNVTLAVGTNKNALCSYFDNSSYVAMGGAGGIDHSTVLSSLIEQEYIFPIKCQISDHIVEAQIQFAVDLTPPRVTSVDDGTRTCGLNEIPSILIYTDENVTHFSYELFKEVSNFNRSSNSTDELVSSGTIPVEQPLTISGLNLEEGETYYLKALAQDAAGFWSSTQVVSDGVLATGSNDTICERDASSPRVTFSTNESCTSVGVQMHCNDDVGCGAIEYGISTSSSSCEVTRGYSGGPLTVDESSWICYSAADRSGNNNSQLKLITFPDTDGDGIANSCDSCAATGNGKIVDSNGCADGQLSNGQELEDADGDGLPDSWEKRYDAIDCSLNFESEDSDANGVRDSDEDYDDDGLNNYEEYTGLRNPCLSDAPISREDDERSFDLPTPTSDGPDVVAIVLFVIGLLMVAGGVGYLVWYYKKTPGQPQRKVAEIQRAVIGKPQIKKTPEWKKNLLFRRKER